jgi:hypothetical protein
MLAFHAPGQDYAASGCSLKSERRTQITINTSFINKKNARNIPLLTLLNNKYFFLPI